MRASADSLNLDVLELICSFLPWNSLAPVALVSTSFHAAAISRLYSRLSFTQRHAKRYPSTETSFTAIANRPSLAVYVRHIDIRAVPLWKGSHHPHFARDCNKALALCKNLLSFKCTVRNLLPPLMMPLLSGKDDLEVLRIHASLTSSQSDIISQSSGLTDLTLDFASWNLLDRLPRWTERLKATLKSLTLHMCTDLNATILHSALSQLPKLRALHAVGSTRLDHIQILSMLPHIPSLECLSLTVSENSKVLDAPQSNEVQHLKHLAVDLRYGENSVNAFATLQNTLNFLKTAPLVSFVIKLPDRQLKLSHSTITDHLLKHFAHTLRRIAALDCSMDLGTISAICRSCINLERFELTVPTKDIDGFASVLSRNKNMHTLIDLEGHQTHGDRIPLAASSINLLFTSSSSLQTIVGDSRIWTRKTKAWLEPKFERKPALGGGNHWFIPPYRYSITNGA